VGVTSEADETGTPQRQHPKCPDNGLLRFDDWKGTFESPMHSDTNPDTAPSFLGKLHKAGKDVQVVVKFVYSYSGTYGTAVHQFLHGLGLAPRLYSAVDLHRGLVMVVMERLDFQEGAGGWVELGTFEKRLGDLAVPVRRKLDQILARLQGQGMVHADMRPKNIMVKVDGQGRLTMLKGEPVLSLIDFDWAGLVGKARYPPLLNPQVLWPEGAKCFKKVGPNDDTILLDNWWGPFVQPAESS
jgi:hypothetical protein